MKNNFKRIFASSAMAVITFVGTQSASFSNVVMAADDQWEAPKIQLPAKLYWGAYSNMDQLALSQYSWDFVRENADGFVFHGAYWPNEPQAAEIAPKILESLNNSDMELMMELGGPAPHTNMDEYSMADVAKENIDRLNKMKEWGFDINEISMDGFPYIMTNLVEQYPDKSAEELLQEAIGEHWVQYVQEIKKAFPDMAINLCAAPPNFQWKDLPSIGQMREMATTSDGKQNEIIWNGYDFVSGIFDESKKIGLPLNGFNADTPYSYSFYDGEEGELSLAHRQKLKDMTDWMHENGYQMTLFCNEAGFTTTDPDEWDKLYKQYSLEAIKLYQSIGIRADRYLFESFYAGPFTIVPETKEGSYTNLIMDAIKYLKGTDQKLDLSIKSSEETQYQGIDQYAEEPQEGQTNTKALVNGTANYEIAVKNNGEVECMPTIVAVDKDNTGWTAAYTYNGKDITKEMQSEEGYVFTDMIKPGESKTVQVTIKPSGDTATEPCKIHFASFWNPQDPTGVIRDVVTAIVNK